MLVVYRVDGKTLTVPSSLFASLGIGHEMGFVQEHAVITIFEIILPTNGEQCAFNNYLEDNRQHRRRIRIKVNHTARRSESSFCDWQ